MPTRAQLRASLASLAVFTCNSAFAQLVVLDSFDAGIGQLVSIAKEPAAPRLWVYPSFGDELYRYTVDGTFVQTFPRRGEAANDVDLEVAPQSLRLGQILVPAGTLLLINGEVGPAEIYGIDIATGDLLATLNTAFGINHVVGGAYHPLRETFFLVQDRQPAGSEQDNLIAEIDPQTGAVLNSFQTTDVLASFTVNFGDIDVDPVTGHLLVVSSDESTILQITPEGVFVQELAVPAGPGSLSGIATDEASTDIFVNDTSGFVYRLGAVADADDDGVADDIDNCTAVANPDQRDTNGDDIGNFCDPDIDNDCLVSFPDLGVYQTNFFVPGDLDTDNNGDGITNFVDLETVKALFFGRPGPSAFGCN